MKTPPYVLPIVLFLGCLFPYVQTLDHSFLYFDDTLYITQNPYVQKGLVGPSVAWAFNTFTGGHFHPLTWLSLMLQSSLGAQKAFAYVAVNALLHACTMVFLYHTMRTLTGHALKAFFIAACVGWHPLRVESVAWVSERKDVLAAFFLFWALHVYVQHATRFSLLRSMQATLLFACCLLAKPTHLFFPCLVGIVAWHQKHFFKPWIKTYALWCCMSAGAAFSAWHAQKATHALQNHTSLWDNLSNACLSLSSYIGLTLYPSRLSVFYPLKSPRPGAVIMAMVLLFLLSYGAFQKRTWWCGWLWYVCALLPYLGILQAGGQSMANRFVYVSSAGLAWMFIDMLHCVSFRARTPVLMGVLVMWGVRSYEETAFFKNTRTLFQHALDSDGDNFFAHNNLGVAYDREGLLEQAGHHFKESVRLHPTYPEALNNYGSYLARIQRLSEAVDYFKYALDIQPSHITAQNNLQEAYRVMGQPLQNPHPLQQRPLP